MPDAILPQATRGRYITPAWRLQAELQKVQRRREDREQEREQRDKEQEQLARDRAVAEAVELEKKEDEVCTGLPSMLQHLPECAPAALTHLKAEGLLTALLDSHKIWLWGS